MIDTHESVKTLRDGGFTDKQAESLVNVLKKIITRQELHDEFSKFEMKLTIKLGSMMILAIGIVATLVKPL